MNRIRELFDLVCDLPESKREAALHEANASAEEIAEVASLLLADATHTRAHAPLASLAADLAETLAGTELHPGDTPALDFTVDSDTQITATAPAGTGIVSVRVTTPAGQSPDTAADDFAYLPTNTGTDIFKDGFE